MLNQPNWTRVSGRTLIILLKLWLSQLSHRLIQGNSETKLKRSLEISSGKRLASSQPLITELLNKTTAGVWRVRVDRDEFLKYFLKWRYFKHYSKNELEKALEHFVSLKLLKPKKGDVFIDVASLSSPFPMVVEQSIGCKVYRQDLIYPPGIHGNTIGGNAGQLPLPGESVTFMTLHCSFEHFEGDSDTRFIVEAARVLKPGGKVCILPLYLKSSYYNLTDPTVDREGLVFDPGAEIREQAGWKNRFGRFYNVDKLKDRIIDHCKRLISQIYFVENEKEMDQSCYLKFILVLEKPVKPEPKKHRHLKI